MTINWFPGHMNKGRRELKEALTRIDVVIELLDARLPHSSRNPLLGRLRGDKPCISILNKSDLADPKVTKAWLRDLEKEENVASMKVSAVQAGSVRGIPKRCQKLAAHRRGPGKTLRCMVVGIPNVGKSTLINTLVGRRVAKVGDQPAVTKREQKIYLANGISLSDTPGILWPKLENQKGAYRLAASGAIRETAFTPVDVALFTAAFLRKRYPDLLKARYKLEKLQEDDEELLEAIGYKRGLLRPGGSVDFERTADILLRELRSGKIGRISFEEPRSFAGESL